MSVASAGGGSAALAAPKDWTTASVYGLGFLAIVNAFNFFDRSVLSLVLPLIKADLKLSDTTLGLVSGLAFVLFYSLLGVPIAALADRTNRRNIIGVGFAFWSLMTVLTGFVANAWQLAFLRFLMGAGEATGVAPSNSMASDLVSPRHRPMSISLISAGSSVASIVFLPIAGMIAQTYGWRATFMAAGAPGLVLALIFLFTVKEPQRGARSRGVAHSKETLSKETLWRTLQFLAGSKTYLLVVLSGIFMGVTIYASLVWSSTFLVRVHHLSIGQVGSMAGPIRGVLGLIGVVLGGFVTVRLSQIDNRWQLWTPALACFLIAPSEVLFLMAGGVPLSLLGMGLSSLFNGMYAAPLFSACISVVRPRMRAASSAVFLLFGSTSGQIIGPVAVGYLNDHLNGALGPEAIRFSMLIGAACALASGLIIVWASTHIRHDIDRAEAAA